ncbi:cytochrome P450 [Aspergillus carlsbadensis]|nr:cytochrome P450 [Aspergillus carlsbadensis]
MAVILALTITFITASLTVLLLRRRYQSPLTDIPGPFLASFTRLWHVIRIFAGDINAVSIREHEKHGPFVRIAHDEVSVCHPDAVRVILLNPIPKAPWYKVLALPDRRFQTPMSETDPKRRVERAKNVASAYTLSNLIKSEEHIDAAIRLMIERFDQFSDDQEPVALDEWFNYLAFDVIGEVVFSESFGFLKSGQDLGSSIANSRSLNAYIAAAGYFQWLHNLTLGNPLLSKLNLMPNNHLFDTTMAALKRRQANPEHRNDMVEHWKTTLAKYPQRMTITDLHATATGTVGAGADTISGALQSFVYHMLRNPQYLERLQVEIAAEQAQGRCRDAVVSYAHAANMEYLQACIKESLRMFGPVPFGLARQAPEGGLKIGDRFFPEGTILSVNPWVMHKCKDFFGPDAHEFNPDRWIGPGAKEIDKYFMPFGAGYNSCPGRNLATIEISKVAATLVRDYDIRQQNPGQEWKYMAYFTAVPYGWPCYISKRAGAVC